MDAGTDFASYMVARWPAVVRTLVLLGCPPPEAHQVAAEALARCSASWDRVRRADDIDAHVYATVLAIHARRQRRPTPQTLPTPESVIVDPAIPEESVALRYALESVLRELPPEDRTAVVLRFVAELDEVQVAEVLDVPVDVVQGRVRDALSRIDQEALREGTP